MAREGKGLLPRKAGAPVPGKKDLESPAFRKEAISDIQQEIRKEYAAISHARPPWRRVAAAAVVVVAFASLIVLLPNFPFAAQHTGLNGAGGGNHMSGAAADTNELSDGMVSGADLQLEFVSHEFVSGLGCVFSAFRGRVICDVSAVHPDQFLEITVTVNNAGGTSGTLLPGDFLFTDAYGEEFPVRETESEGYLGADGKTIEPGMPEEMKVAFEIPQSVSAGTVTYKDKAYEIKPPAPLGTIELNKYTVSFGDQVNATFFPPEGVDIYIRKGCTNPWQIARKNSAQQWVPFPQWQPDSADCAERCENNFIYEPQCTGECTAEDQCVLVEAGAEERNSSWALKTYTTKTGICQLQLGEFTFIEAAAKGQYKFEFEYYEDSRCSQPRVAERIFSVK